MFKPSKTPGLIWRDRNGKSAAIWMCRTSIAKRGYPVKTARLWTGPLGTRPASAEMISIGQECERLQAEMKEWGRHPDPVKRANWRRKGAIYFVRSGDHVKIGFASDLDKRMSALQLAHPTQLELLGAIPGNQQIEKFLHWQFQEAHERGEWFRLTDKLRSFIAEKVQETPLANVVNLLQERRNRTKTVRTD